MNRIKNLRIIGGKSLVGGIKIVPNKNAILPALVASILTKETMTYKNVPRSPDVEKVLLALKDIGAEVEDSAATISICCRNITKSVISGAIIRDMQAGYLFIGPLLARFKEATIPITSGCALGYRGPEGHIEYLSELSAKHTFHGESVHFYLPESISDDTLVERDGLNYQERFVVYTQPKVTPTENVLMLLSKTSRYKTEVSGIAQEPHVGQLIHLLRTMGANIHGKGSTVQVIGADTLKGATFIAEPDHIDYFGCVVMAVMTKSDILLEMDLPFLAPGIVIMNKFIKQMGIKLSIEGGNVRVLGSISNYAPDETFPKEVDGNKITYLMNPGPWPGFPVDGLPAFIALSAMNNNPLSKTVTNNWLYRDGLKYVKAMKKMGAVISYRDNQRVTVNGTVSGNPFAKEEQISIYSPNVIEGSRALLYCAMAGGDYVVNNAQYILRRSPQFFELHKKMGANIEVFEYDEVPHNGHS